MNVIFASLISALVGLFFGVLFEGPLIKARDGLIRRVRRRLGGRRRPQQRPQTFALDSIVTTWIVVDGDGESEYAPQTIQCHFDPHSLELPPELMESRNQAALAEEKKRNAGLPFRWNGEIYYLDRFVISRNDTEEFLALQLWFGPTDYYTFQATNMRLDEQDLRERYVGNWTWERPIPYFSSSFGISLAVITSDEQIVLTQRSALVGSRQGQFNISVNEALSPLLDRSTEGHAPDVYRCAIRGAAEELGIALNHFDITFLSFGVDSQYSQWGLLGMARVNKRADDILRWRAMGVKDKWENESLHVIQFAVDPVIDFVLKTSPWAPSGLACLYHALVHEYNRTAVDQALAKRSAISPRTPGQDA